MSSSFLFNAILLAPLHDKNVTYAGGMQAAGQEIIWYTPNMLKTITTNEHHSSLS
jgi:hypothetical protein